ncbi:MAG: hypothetical protein IJ899_12645 [Blautia sp.]|nr:hypothetical protein [Blautia sp.]
MGWLTPLNELKNGFLYIQEAVFLWQERRFEIICLSETGVWLSRAGNTVTMLRSSSFVDARIDFLLRLACSDLSCETCSIYYRGYPKAFAVKGKECDSVALASPL